MTEPRKRKCKACHHPFAPARSTQVACGIDCAMQLAHDHKAKVAECDRLDTVRKDPARKYTVDELRAIRDEYRLKLRGLVKEREIE